MTTVVKNEEVEIKQATPGSAGYDLRTTKPIMLAPGERLLVKTGLYLSMPTGMAALITPRSGLALKHGITVLNSPGLIDSDYRDEIGVILHNTSNEYWTAQAGDRIAQMVFVSYFSPVFHEYPLEAFKVITSKEDRGGGFGSTEVK